MHISSLHKGKWLLEMQRGKNEDQRVAQNQVPKGPFYMIAFALLNKLETLKCSISQYKLIHR